VGLLCLGAAVLAAGLLRLTVRDSDEFLAQQALSRGKTATES
jgi:hypothetical protein